jgi:hypothetical protein
MNRLRSLKKDKAGVAASTCAMLFSLQIHSERAEARSFVHRLEELPSPTADPGIAHPVLARLNLTRAG